VCTGLRALRGMRDRCAGSKFRPMVDETDGYYITPIPATFGTSEYWLVTHVDGGTIGEAPTRSEAQAIADRHFADQRSGS
jgi:hypothetical protein